MSMTIKQMSDTIEEAKATLVGAQFAMSQGTRRIHELETALNRMVLAYENTLADSEGRWPEADCGCVFCTQGQVPDKLNTGPCAYHSSRQLLGQL